jgi:hypothetical protein
MKSHPFYSILIIIEIGLHIAACKKSDTEPATYTTLKVLAFKTNLPIAAAEVKIYECNSPAYAGCSDRSLLQTLTTDKDGNFQFDSKLNFYDIRASLDGYWEGVTGGNDVWGNYRGVSNIFLAPIANTKIHIRKINPHPPELYLVVNLDKDTYSLFFPSVTKTFAQPADTTVLVSCFGYMDNLINWYFINAQGVIDTANAGGQIPAFYVSRFDTAFVEINY